MAAFAMREIVETERPGGTSEFSYHRQHIARVRARENDSVERYKCVKRSGRVDSSGDTVRRSGSCLRRQ